MNEIINKKIVWIVAGLSVLCLFTILFSNKLVDNIVEKHYDKIADKVIQKLQKEYCPSPYGPGIDPDKINVDKFL
jgi:uncharacterized protein involved in cysteine biosynthesis